jgi:hypothetical protein
MWCGVYRKEDYPQRLWLRHTGQTHCVGQEISSGECHEKASDKLVHEGEYVAEVDIELIYTDEVGRHLSLDDALKLDDVRQALRKGDLKGSSQRARVYSLTPIAL